MGYTADRKLWLTADKERVVEDGSAEAAFLFATPGTEVSDDDAEKYGLKAPKPVKQADPPEDKQAPAPANKARKPAKKK